MCKGLPVPVVEGAPQIQGGYRERFRKAFVAGEGKMGVWWMLKDERRDFFAINRGER